jgi:hypothetical protein
MFNARGALLEDFKSEEVATFWVMTSCSNVVAYRRFGSTWLPPSSRVFTTQKAAAT